MLIRLHRDKLSGKLEIALTGIMILYILVMVQAKLNCFDLFLHLATGRYIIENSSIPRQDVFSFTNLGRPWTCHEWGFGVFIYLLYKAIGLELLSLLKPILIGLTFYLCIRITRLKGAQAWALFIPIFLSLKPVHFNMLLRPQLLTFMFLVLVQYLLERNRYSGEKRLLYLLPPIFLIWANVHGAVIIGMGYYLLYLVACFMDLKLNLPIGTSIDKERMLKAFCHALLMLPVSWLVSLLNPSNIGIYTYYFKVRGLTKDIFILEWQPPTLSGHSWFFVYFAFAVIMFLLCWRRFGAVELFTLIAFGYLGLSARRNMAIFVFMSLPIVALAITTAGKWIYKKLGNKPLRRCLQVVYAAVILGLGSFMAISVINDWRLKYGIGVEEKQYPQRAADFIEQNQLVGQMFNSYQIGGYLIWRFYGQRQVFYDGRTVLHSSLLTKLTRQTWERIFEDLEINFCIISSPWKHAVVENLVIQDLEAWRLVYWDAEYLVYLKDDVINQPVIEQHGYQYANPSILVSSLPISEYPILIEELERNLALAPDNPMALTMLATVYAIQGGAANKAEAMRLLREAIELDPRFAKAYARLSYLYYQIGKYSDSVDFGLKAMQLGVQTDELWFLVGKAYVKLGDKKKAASIFRNLNQKGFIDDELLYYLKLAEG